MRSGPSNPNVIYLYINQGCSYNPDGTESEAPKYTYKHADMRPWDPRNDVMQYESNYQLLTKTRHKTPMMRTQSIVSVLAPGPLLAQSSRRRKTKQRSQDSDTSNNAAPTPAKVPLLCITDQVLNSLCPGDAGVIQQP